MNKVAVILWLMTTVFFIFIPRLTAEEPHPPYIFMPLATEANDPVPYERSEFPELAWSARRFEVICLGSIPITYMFSMLGYDFAMYAKDDFSSTHVWGYRREEQDLFNMLTIAASISVAIAIADQIIYQYKRGKRDKYAQTDVGSQPSGR